MEFFMIYFIGLVALIFCLRHVSKPWDNRPRTYEGNDED